MEDSAANLDLCHDAEPTVFRLVQIRRLPVAGMYRCIEIQIDERHTLTIQLAR
jgi:hypothetical protein